MEQAEIGLIGLGVMGSNLSLNIAEKGNKIAVFNRSPEATRKFYAEAGELQGQVIPCETLEEFVAAIRPPRPIIIMIKAGDPVDQQLKLLEPYLSAGDIMIDAGNANFRRPPASPGCRRPSIVFTSETSLVKHRLAFNSRCFISDDVV